MRARLVKKKTKIGRELSKSELKRAMRIKEDEARKLQARVYISLCELAEYRTENQSLFDINYDIGKENAELRKNLDYKEKLIKDLENTVDKLNNIIVGRNEYIKTIKESNEFYLENLEKIITENEKIKSTLAYKVLAKLKMA